MLSKAGYRFAFANRFGRRCNSGNAYVADELTKQVKDDCSIVWIECRSPLFDSQRDIIVDHHNPVSYTHLTLPTKA